jgi:hypothetical protein
MSGIKFVKIDFNTVPVPESGKAHVGIDVIDGLMKMKVDTGETLLIGGGGDSTWIDTVMLRAKPTRDEGTARTRDDSCYAAPNVEIIYDGDVINQFATVIFNFANERLNYRTFDASGALSGDYSIGTDILRSSLGWSSLTLAEPFATWRAVDSRGDPVARIAAGVRDDGMGNYVFGLFDYDAGADRFSCNTYIYVDSMLRGVGPIAMGSNVFISSWQAADFTEVLGIIGYAGESVTEIRRFQPKYGTADATALHSVIAKSSSDNVFYFLVEDARTDSKSYVIGFRYDGTDFKGDAFTSVEFNWGREGEGKPMRMAIAGDRIYVLCKNDFYEDLVYYVDVDGTGRLGSPVAMPLVAMPLVAMPSSKSTGLSNYASIAAAEKDGKAYIAISGKATDAYTAPDLYLYEIDVETDAVLRCQYKTMPLTPGHGHLNMRFVNDGEDFKLLIPPATLDVTADITTTGHGRAPAS